MSYDVFGWKLVLSASHLDERLQQRAEHHHIEVGMGTQIQLIGPQQQQIGFATAWRATDEQTLIRVDIQQV